MFFHHIAGQSASGIFHVFMGTNTSLFGTTI